MSGPMLCRACGAEATNTAVCFQPHLAPDSIVVPRAFRETLYGCAEHPARRRPVIVILKADANPEVHDADTGERLTHDVAEVAIGPGRRAEAVFFVRRADTGGFLVAGDGSGPVQQLAEVVEISSLGAWTARPPALEDEQSAEAVTQ